MDRPPSRLERSLEAGAQAPALIQQYLAYGNAIPEFDELQALAAQLRPAQHRGDVRYYLSGMYLELAMHPQSPDDKRYAYVCAAMSYAQGPVETQESIHSPQDVEYVYKCGLLKAYERQFIRSAVGEPTTLEDELATYRALLLLGGHAIETNRNARDARDKMLAARARGSIFEISVLLLNARMNLRYGEILQHAWPSLPRQDQPRNSSAGLQVRSGWDIAVSPNYIWDDDAQRVQLKSSLTTKSTYEDEIIVVAGKEHLESRYTGEIILAALKEADRKSSHESAEVTTILDERERKFLERLGWRY